MGKDQTEDLKDVNGVLAAYLSSDLRLTAYESFFASEVLSWKSVDPTAVGMITASLEGECDNPPQDIPPAASIAAWAYVQAGSLTVLTRKSFHESVATLVNEASQDNRGTLLIYEAIEELSSGLLLLAESLEGYDTDSLLSPAFEAVGNLLAAILARSEFDYEHSYEGTAVVESAVVDWLLDNMQSIIDYAKMLHGFAGINVSVRDDLEDALDALRSGNESFVEDAR